MSEKTILVPSDFSAVADNAINHANRVAETTGSSITVLHVVSAEKKKEMAQKKLDMYLERHRTEYPKANFRSHVSVGNIFDDIGDVAKEIGASLIVMGTHGMKGMQFLVGSNALRVVSNSETPIIIVQERPARFDDYNDIVVPMDLSKETKQKLKVVADLGKYFDSRVHLVSPSEKDEHLKNQLSRNMAYAKQYMIEQGLSPNCETAEEDSGDFDDGVIRHAVKKDADIIAIMNLGVNSLMGIFGGKFAQRIITNEAQIPVLILNPKSMTLSSDVFGVFS